jgi:hypothetical protein
MTPRSRLNIVASTSLLNLLKLLSSFKTTAGREIAGASSPTLTEASGPPPGYESHSKHFFSADAIANTSNPVTTVARTVTIFPSNSETLLSTSQVVSDCRD